MQNVFSFLMRKIKAFATGRTERMTFDLFWAESDPTVMSPCRPCCCVPASDWPQNSGVSTRFYRQVDWRTHVHLDLVQLQLLFLPLVLLFLLFLFFWCSFSFFSSSHPPPPPPLFVCFFLSFSSFSSTLSSFDSLSFCSVFILVLLLLFFLDHFHSLFISPLLLLLLLRGVDWGTCRVLLALAEWEVGP